MSSKIEHTVSTPVPTQVSTPVPSVPTPAAPSQQTPPSHEQTPPSHEQTPPSHEQPPNNEIHLLDAPITDENTALNAMVRFLGVAQKRGAFAINESAKIYECINIFQSRS